MSASENNPYRSPGDALPEISLAKRLVAAWLLVSLAGFFFSVAFSLFKFAFYGLTGSVTLAYAASWLPYYGIPFFSAMAAGLVGRWSGMFAFPFRRGGSPNSQKN